MDIFNAASLGMKALVQIIYSPEQVKSIAESSNAATGAVWSNAINEEMKMLIDIN